MFNLLKSVLGAALFSMAVLGSVACQGNPSPVSPSEDPAPSVAEYKRSTPIATAPGGALDPAGGGAVRLVRLKPGTTLDQVGKILTGIVAKLLGLVGKVLGLVLQTKDAKFVVLPGSVIGTTRITMQPLPGPYIMFKFGPSGTRFSRPATLTIYATKADLDPTTKRRLRIAGASDNAENWTIIGGTYDPRTDSVTVPITHFSRYALCVE